MGVRTLVRSVPIAAHQIHSVKKTCSGKIAKLTRDFHRRRIKEGTNNKDFFVKAVIEESMPATWSSGMLLSREETYHIRLSSITAGSYIAHFRI